MTPEQLKIVLMGNECSSEVTDTETITDSFLDVYEKTLPKYKNSLATVRRPEKNVDISFLPFSFGPLHAEGVFKASLKSHVSKLDN